MENYASSNAAAIYQLNGKVANDNVRGGSWPLYASAGIPEFWLNNIEKNEIEVHRTPAADVYKSISIHRSGDRIFLQDLDTSFNTEVLLGNIIK